MEIINFFEKAVQTVFPAMGFEKIIVMLVTGYFGYVVAYSGLPTKDRWAKILIFSMPSVISSAFFDGIADKFFFIYFIGSALVSMVLAGIWRRWGRLGMQKILRKTKISNENDYDSIQEYLP